MPHNVNTSSYIAIDGIMRFNYKKKVIIAMDESSLCPTICQTKRFSNMFAKNLGKFMIGCVVDVTFSNPLPKI